MKAIKYIYPKYALLKEIGRGATGKVYEGKELKTNNVVAIKKIPLSKFTYGNTEKFTKREINALVSLSHENLIKFITVERTENNVYLILEYCNGGTLKEYQTYDRNKYNMELNEFYVQKIIRQFIKGLEYMHKNNTIHRDIKLDNIMLNFNKYPNIVLNDNDTAKVNYDQVDLNDDFTVKIADLGFAKHLDHTQVTSTMLGTPTTMSPDVMNIKESDSKTYSIKADLWSLGIITYQLVIGRLPFTGKDFNELRTTIQNGKYSYSKKLNLSIEVISFINGLLQDEPKKRMNWEEIKNHPFITTEVSKFHFINLNNYGDINESNLEMNTKDCNNYIWLNIENKSFNKGLDKINIDDIEKEEVKSILGNTRIDNIEIIQSMREKKEGKSQYEIHSCDSKPIDNSKKKEKEVDKENLRLSNEKEFKTQPEDNVKKNLEEWQSISTEVNSKAPSKNSSKNMINDSEHLAKVGTHSGRFDPCATSCDEINARLFSKRKLISMNGKQEQNFRVEINKVNLVIKEIQGDGNCLFRAISDQVYGDERYHDILRDKCMDYISIERKFFSQFVEGGEASFDEYIAMKRTSGVWGDDIELQALSEIYNRPIEIFLNSNKPLKTFHENYDGCSRNCNNVDYNNINNVKKFPIRVSYHGKAHYNSVIPSKTNYEYSLYVNAMLSSKPGEAEEAFILRIAKDKEKKEEDIAKARQRFKESQTNKNIDDLLFDTLTLSDKAANENVAKAMKESELEGYENELIDSVKKISLENTNEDIDYYSIPSIQTALEFGFSLDDAIIAYSLYGNKSDLMLQYLYSLNMNN